MCMALAFYYLLFPLFTISFSLINFQINALVSGDIFLFVLFLSNVTSTNLFVCMFLLFIVKNINAFLTFG